MRGPQHGGGVEWGPKVGSEPGGTVKMPPYSVIMFQKANRAFIRAYLEEYHLRGKGLLLNGVL